MDLISKYELNERIVHTEDEAILKQISNLLAEEEVESWENLEPSLKASLKRGLAQSAKGDLIPHAKVMKNTKEVPRNEAPGVLDKRSRGHL